MSAPPPPARFPDNVPKVVGRPWVGGVDRETWLWMQRQSAGLSAITTWLNAVFGGGGSGAPGSPGTPGAPGATPSVDDLELDGFFFSRGGV